MFGKNMFGRNKKKIRKAIPFISGFTGISSALLSAHFFESIDGAMAAGGFIQRTLADYLYRNLSPMQERRVITAAALAVDFVDKRLKKGETLRNDGFFPEGTVSRSDAVEVVDAMLFTARDEWQEQKIQYLAKLIENASFDSQIRAGLLHFLCKKFESLTYRQLCIIKMVIENKYPLSLKSVVETPWLTEEPVPLLSKDSMPTLAECVDLGHLGYISYEQSPPDDKISGAVALLVPNTMRHTVLGLQMYSRMGLGSIPEEDVQPLAKSLQGSRTQR